MVRTECQRKVLYFRVYHNSDVAGESARQTDNLQGPSLCLGPYCVLSKVVMYCVSAIKLILKTCVSNIYDYSVMQSAQEKYDLLPPRGL